MTQDPVEQVWYDGALCPITAVSVHPLSYSLNYGYGCFEGIRAYADTTGHGALFRLDCHLKRLFRSAKIIGMETPYDFDTLKQAHIDVLKANKLDNAYLRPLCFIDEGLGLHNKNLKIHVFVAARPTIIYAGDEKTTQGLTLKTASYIRNHPNSGPTKAKVTANYLNSILALNEARAANCDDALMLDHMGFVAECSAANIFMVKRNKLITPDLAVALDGITRDSILTLASDLGIHIEIRRIARDEIATADEVFITGTAAEIAPVVALDYHMIGDGKRGTITKLLQEAYFAEVYAQASARHPEWLTYV